MPSSSGSPSPVDRAALFQALPTPYLVLTPDLVVADANAAYLAVVGRTRADILGRPVFEAFPPAADALDASGVSRVQRSLERARDTGRPDTMPIQKYDLPDPATGELAERWWSLISVPVLDERGRTALVVQRTEDITDYVLERDRRTTARPGGGAERRRVADVEADLYARSRELEQARQAEAEATQRLAALADVALRMARTETLEELTGLIVDRGLSAVGADGGAVAVRDGTPVLHQTTSARLGQRARARYARMPLDGPLPGSVVARTGTRVLLPDMASGLAWHPAAQAVLDDTGCRAWATLPLQADGRLLGSLSIGWVDDREFTHADLEVLEALAAQCAYGLDRLQAREAEREAASAAHRMSETLQRSLLLDPPPLDGLRAAVRYRPAARQAQVGGDWYDAFVTASGATSVVIGDVAGHDQEAAAVMGQLRNLLRGVAYTLGQPPAAVLSALDRALRDLAVGSLATAVLAQVDPAQPGSPDRRLCWSSAGHPPPLLLDADGTVRLLDTEPDLLLGLDADTPRVDHELFLRPGATLLLYTDGLVERRGASVTEGLDQLVRAAQDLVGLDPDAVCDALLAQAGASGDDDVALLALAVLPAGG